MAEQVKQRSSLTDQLGFIIVVFCFANGLLGLITNSINAATDATIPLVESVMSFNAILAALSCVSLIGVTSGVPSFATFGVAAITLSFFRKVGDTLYLGSGYHNRRMIIPECAFYVKEWDDDTMCDVAYGLHLTIAICLSACYAFGIVIVYQHWKFQHQKYSPSPFPTTYPEKKSLVYIRDEVKPVDKPDDSNWFIPGAEKY